MVSAEDMPTPDVAGLMGVERAQTDCAAEAGHVERLVPGVQHPAVMDHMSATGTQCRAASL